MEYTCEHTHTHAHTLVNYNALFFSVFLCSPQADSARPLSVDEMYLCDSGAQYWDGTTDVTRTMHFGTPTHFQKVCELECVLSSLLLVVISPCSLVAVHVHVCVYIYEPVKDRASGDLLSNDPNLLRCDNA